MKNQETVQKGELKCRLKEVRRRLGLTQQDLAEAAGITRQTIGGIEATLFAPSAAVALRLARALGCRVEEIFWLEDEPIRTVTARAARTLCSDHAPSGGRVLLGRVGKNWVAHNLSGDAAFRTEMVPADGLAEPHAREGQLSVQLLDSPDALQRTVLLAGCAPSFALWVRSAERWQPQLRAAWLHANSTRALEALLQDEVHIAGMHIHDAASGEDNVPFVRQMLKRKEVESTGIILINFGAWEEGLIVAPGNPKKVHGVDDLCRVKLINREPGAGARILLDALLDGAQVKREKICGYHDIASTHQAVARAVLAGAADAGSGTAAIADTFGLDFVPLRRVRFDLAIKTEHFEFEPVQQLLETLHHRQVRQQLQRLGGHDTTHAGEVVARM